MFYAFLWRMAHSFYLSGMRNAYIMAALAAALCTGCETECPPYHSPDGTDCQAWVDAYARIWQVDSCHCTLGSVDITGNMVPFVRTGPGGFTMDGLVPCTLIDDRSFDSPTVTGTTTNGQTYTVRATGFLRENTASGGYVNGIYLGAYKYNTIHTTWYYNEGLIGAFSCDLVLK